MNKQLQYRLFLALLSLFNAFTYILLYISLKNITYFSFLIIVLLSTIVNIYFFFKQLNKSL
jgi:hypothetical protein